MAAAKKVTKKAVAKAPKAKAAKKVTKKSYKESY